MTISISPSPLTMIGFADTVALDSFGRLRVSSPSTLFDSQQEYGLDTLRIWDASANGTLSYATGATNGSVTSGSNAVGPRDASTRMTPITCSSTNGHYAILQSRTYHRYIPGRGHLVLLTGIFSAHAGAAVSIVRRTSTSGSAVDTAIAQSSWNIDKMDGTGPSGITLDFTKTQILVIQAQWLGVGRVIVGFDVDGVLYPAHQFLNANSLAVPYTQTFNLPVRLQATTSGSTTVAESGYFDAANGIFLRCTSSTAGGTIQFVCCSVQSEGGQESKGFPLSFGSATSIGVTTRRPVMSIRPKTTYNSITNRAHIELDEVDFAASANSAYWELVIGGTLTGAAFASVSTASVSEYDTTATAISGGVTLMAGFVAAGSGSTKGISSGMTDLRGVLVLSQIDASTATQPALTLVCTSLSGTSNVNSSMHWHEQVV